MRRLRPSGLLSAALSVALVASCAGPALGDADSHFRRGEYGQALAIYEEHGDADDSGTVGQRIRRTRYFVLEDAARDLLHQNRPDDAMEVLEALSDAVPLDRVEEVEELHRRCLSRLAHQAVLDARLALEDDRAEEATEIARYALGLDPNADGAQEVLARADRRIASDSVAAQAAYLDGMEDLRLGFERRALTAFLSALNRAPEDARAAARVEAVTLDLANEQRTRGRLDMEAGRLGLAWVALNDAVRLEPDNEEGVALLTQLELRIEGEQLMSSADLAVRGGHPDAADGFLAELAALGAEIGGLRAERLAQSSREVRNQNDYVRARAFELDAQSIHAQALYAEILERETGFGWEDVELRHAALGRRIADAEVAYQTALTAQQAGETDAYRAALVEVLRLASDYSDALERYQAVIAGPEAEADGGDEGT